MVQGLAFLSKKSWHTKNISNQEKVWIAEQREQAEKQKTAELAKQIQQEKEEEELSKIAGHTKQLDRGINWMYDGHHAHSETAKEDAAKQAEEYLLGKEYHGGPTGKVVGDLDAAAVAHEGVNAVVSLESKPAASSETWEELEHRRQNEAFRMRHEDPMFAVSLQAVRKEKDREQRKELYERAGFSVQAVRINDPTAPEELTREERRAQRRDKRKKENKESKKKKSKKSSYDGRRRSRKPSSRHHASSRRRRRSRSRSRGSYSSESSSEHSSYSSDYDEVSRNRHHRRHQHDNDDDRKRRRRDNHWGSPPLERDHRDRSRVDNRKHPPPESSYHDRDRPPQQLVTADSYYDGNGKQPSHARPSDRYNDDRDRRRNHHSPPPRESDRERRSSSSNDFQSEQQKPSGYGLQAQGRVGSSSNNSANGDLGPDPKLLQRKREERDAERRRLEEQQSRRRYQTPAEREAARRELEQNASRWTRERRDPHATNNNNNTEQQQDNTSSTTTGNASFIHEMTQQVHGINQDQNLSERLRQNRNNQQRNNDTFL